MNTLTNKYDSSIFIFSLNYKIYRIMVEEVKSDNAVGQRIKDKLRATPLLKLIDLYIQDKSSGCG